MLCYKNMFDIDNSILFAFEKYVTHVEKCCYDILQAKEASRLQQLFKKMCEGQIESRFQILSLYAYFKN